MLSNKAWIIKAYLDALTKGDGGSGCNTKRVELDAEGISTERSEVIR